MTSLRRIFLHAAISASAIPHLSEIASAQAYPTRPVRSIVTFAAGGAQDTVARLIGQWLTERLGQPFIIENRAGGGGNIGTELVARALPDGYTLLFSVGTANAVNATLYKKLNFNFIRDIAPVAGIARAHLVMLVHPSVPANTAPEFIAYAKANPGKISYASAGVGSQPHMAAELFKMLTGTNIVHVPYRGGGPALSDLIGGQVDMMFTILPTLDHVRAGKLRALAVTTTSRSKEFPDIPAVGEFVPGFETSFWSGVGAPKNTAAEIINKLNYEIGAGLADPKIGARLRALGGAPMPMTPSQLRELIAAETAKWAKVTKFAGIKPQ